MRGISLEHLSVRYHVPVEDIRRHLDKAIVKSANGEMTVRTNAEINQASARARNDLVSILLESIDELSVSTLPRLSQLSEFEKLLESAAKLFQWPRLTVSRVLASNQTVGGYSANMNEVGQPTGAVNLALIATSPEQLAMLAKKQEENFGATAQPNSQEGLSSQKVSGQQPPQ